MEGLEPLVAAIKDAIDNFGIPVAGEVIPLKVIALLGTGVFLTLRLGFVQFRRLGHGFMVTTGRYDDPNEPGDVSHFQALTTALSATVGIGNIAGAAWAIHYGGPGALFWMWMTALLGIRLTGGEAAPEAPAEILELVNKREEARKARDWGSADRYRDELRSRGWVVEDRAEGPLVKSAD